MSKAFIIILLSLVALAARAAEYPTPVQGNVVLRDFHFASGETLAERVKPDHPEGLGGAGLTLRWRHFAHSQSELNVLESRHVREQRV